MRKFLMVNKCTIPSLTKIRTLDDTIFGIDPVDASIVKLSICGIDTLGINPPTPIKKSCFR